jgi:hypothetical protein
MYETEIDRQLLRKNIKPYGESQQTSWRLYDIHKDKPGFVDHGNHWDSFEKHGVKLERLVDWDIPQVLGMSSTFSLRPTLPTSRPTQNFIREMNIYHDNDLARTHEDIIRQTQDTELSADTHRALRDFLEPMGWEKIRYSRFQQYPGEMTFSHVDVHRQMSNLHNSHTDPILCGEIRIGVIFLNDWAYGQGFGAGQTILQNWKVGDFHEFPWFFPHHTFNNSNVERNSITVIGRKRYQ